MSGSKLWITVVAFAMTVFGKWSLPPLCLASVALVALAHTNTLLGLVRVALLLSSTTDVETSVATRRACTVRCASITRSRVLHVLATLLLGMTLAVGDVALGVTRVAVLVVVLVPWFSLHLRWSLERPILTGAGAHRPAITPR